MIHIEHSSRTRSRTLFKKELTWALSSREIDAVTRIHGRETFRRGEGSHRNYHLHPPPLPLLVLLPLLLSLVGTRAYLIVLVTSALLYVDQNTLVLRFFFLSYFTCNTYYVDVPSTAQPVHLFLSHLYSFALLFTVMCIASPFLFHHSYVFFPSSYAVPLGLCAFSCSINTSLVLM